MKSQLKAFLNKFKSCKVTNRITTKEWMHLEIKMHFQKSFSQRKGGKEVGEKLGVRSVKVIGKRWLCTKCLTGRRNGSFLNVYIQLLKLESFIFPKF